MVLDILNPWRRPTTKDAFEPTAFAALLFHAPAKLLLYHAYHILTLLRSTPAARPSPVIRVVCISDTHTHIPDHVPAGDILIHAGDLTDAGSVAEIQAQIDWLASLPHREIIVIAGNHDTFLDPRTRPSLEPEQRAGTLDWGRVHYLQHKLLTLTLAVDPQGADADVDTDADAKTPLLRAAPASAAGERAQRRVRIYGAPQIPACGPASVHAFQYARSSDAWSETVPDDTDILVTHTPPRFHLDLPLPHALGCEFLLAEVARVKPALHVFGHVHWGAGRQVVWWDGAHEAYVQGMGAASGLSPRLWWSVVRVLYRGLRELLWAWVWGGQRAHTVMVNAALMHGNTGRLGKEKGRVQVVDI
jgi:calcineurin-like phosphoesterase family protein